MGDLANWVQSKLELLGRCGAAPAAATTTGADASLRETDG